MTGDSQPRQFFHGPATDFAPGDLVNPTCELGGKPGKSHAFVTTSADVARDYGRHKATAQWAIGNDAARPRAYEVEPTGPIERDDTVNERFLAWRTRHPLRVVRDVTEQPQRQP